MDASILSAAGKYSAAKFATEPVKSSSGIESVLGSTASSFADTLRKSEEVATSAMVSSVDPHSLVQALAQSELAVDTVVTIRNRVVEAYQEILRMPV